MERRLTGKKPKIKHEDGGSIKGLKPIGDLRPVVINRRNSMTCVVRQDELVTEPDNVYEPAGTL